MEPVVCRCVTAKAVRAQRSSRCGSKGAASVVNCNNPYPSHSAPEAGCGAVITFCILIRILPRKPMHVHNCTAPKKWLGSGHVKHSFWCASPRSQRVDTRADRKANKVRYHKKGTSCRRRCPDVWEMCSPTTMKRVGLAKQIEYSSTYSSTYTCTPV